MPRIKSPCGHPSTKTHRIVQPDFETRLEHDRTLFGLD